MSMVSFQCFETDRLDLRPTSIEDATYVLQQLNTPKWLQYIGDRNIKTSEDAVNYIEERMLPQLEKLGYSNYTVIRKSDRQKIGSCGLYKREGLDYVDIGFAFLPEYEKQGYAFESASALLDAARHIFLLKKVQAITTKENKSSQKLLEKLGLQFQKIIRLPKDPEDLLLYEIDLQES